VAQRKTSTGDQDSAARFEPGVGKITVGRNWPRPHPAIHVFHHLRNNFRVRQRLAGEQSCFFCVRILSREADQEKSGWKKPLAQSCVEGVKCLIETCKTLRPPEVRRVVRVEFNQRRGGERKGRRRFPVAAVSDMPGKSPYLLLVLEDGSGE
jgi:hypothetical protein